jgi:hypothetical protein
MLGRYAKLIAAVFITGFFLLGSPVQAGSTRMEHRFGGYFSVIGDPFPTLIGINAGANVFDFMRVVVGYGKISTTFQGEDSNGNLTNGTLSATTLGGGLRFFMPNWNFTPMVGLSFANVSVSLTGTSNTNGNTVDGFSGSQSHVYAAIGFDWQTHAGFNMGAGWNQSFLSGVGGLPYLNFGWFF